MKVARAPGKEVKDQLLLHLLAPMAACQVVYLRTAVQATQVVNRKKMAMYAKQIPVLDHANGAEGSVKCYRIRMVNEACQEPTD